MDKELEELEKESLALLENCRELDKELKALKDGVNFLLNEYRTNKRYFRESPGRVTTEDIIKTCFEFGWASRKNYDNS